MKYFIFSGLLVFFQFATAQMQAPTAPTYDDCSKYTAIEDGQTVYTSQYYSCQNSNAIKKRDYDAAVTAYNRGTRIISDDSGSVVKPTEPAYENCGTIGDDYDYSCQQRNAAKQRDYNIQMMGYNEAVKQQQDEALKEKQAAELAQQQDLEAAARDATAKSLAGQQKANESSQIHSMLSAGFAGAFAASCGPGSCSYPLLALSIANAIFSGMSNKAAGQYGDMAYETCMTGNQLSNNGGVDCNNLGGSSSAQNPFDSQGNCKLSKAECDKLLSQLPANLKKSDIKTGMSSFASSKPPFKVNPDGTITGPDGKKYSAANFMTEKDMIAAGISPADAKAMMAKMKALDAANAAELAKNELERLKKLGASGGAGSADSALTGGGKEILINGNASGGKDLAGSGKRGLASTEGLSREFNGELIGVAGDDIFKMMNRRYKLKTSQDTFIAP